MKQIRFSQNLREISKSRHLTINKMAEMCFISEQSMGRYFRGGEPTLIMVCSIAEALNISLDDLVYADKGGRWSD